MRRIVFALVGIALAGFGYFLITDAGARSGEVELSGTVTSVETIERSDGRARNHYRHTVAFIDPSGDDRTVESRSYWKSPPTSGERVDVFMNTSTGDARVATPQSRRNGYAAIGGGIMVALLALAGQIRSKS